MLRNVVTGAAAGAAGTTVLNALTYADMTWRARPASSTPEETVEKLAERAPVDVPGTGEGRTNRVQALGALTGIVTGVGVGAAYGLARALGLRPGPLAGSLLTAGAAFLVANGPMTVLGVTDPRTWAATDWASDVVPHLAYGVTTALTAQAAETR